MLVLKYIKSSNCVTCQDVLVANLSSYNEIFSYRIQVAKKLAPLAVYKKNKAIAMLHYDLFYTIRL